METINNQGQDARNESPDFVQQMAGVGAMETPGLRGFGYPPVKRKWAVALLSIFIPGTGHFYLGNMQKGLLMMLLLILDIVCIGHFTGGSSNTALVTFFSLMIPVIYFYNIFDALQTAEKVNNRRTAALGLGITEPDWDTVSGQQENKLNTGWFLIGGGVFLFIISTKPEWLDDFLSSFGSYVGALVLIAAGILMFAKEYLHKK